MTSIVHYADRTHDIRGKEVTTGNSTLDTSKVTCPVCRAGGFGPTCFTCHGPMTGRVTGDRHCKKCRKLYKWESSYDYPRLGPLYYAERV